jgi:hypothetical protein
MIVSDFIRIPKGAIITNFASLAYSPLAYCAFYASNNADSFISAVVPNAETDIHVYGNLFYGSTRNPDIPEGAKYIRVAYNSGFAGGEYGVSTDLSIANQGRPILTFGYPEEIEFVASNVDLFVFAGQSNMQGQSEYLSENDV